MHWATSRLSQDSLYLVNVGVEGEKGKQMKIKWKHSSEREKLIILFACWCKTFNSALCWAPVLNKHTIRSHTHTYADSHMPTLTHNLSHLELYPNLGAQLCCLWWLCLTQQNVHGRQQCHSLFCMAGCTSNLSSHHSAGHDIYLWTLVSAAEMWLQCQASDSCNTCRSVFFGMWVPYTQFAVESNSCGKTTRKY